MRGRTGLSSAARLCALSAGIQVVWGAVLAVTLQERSSALGGGDGVRAYATVAASGALAATIVQLVAGRFADRTRARTGHRGAFYAIGVALSLPALGWLYLAPTFPQLVAAFLALECAMNVVGGPYQAAIADYIPRRERGAASSWMAAYQSIGNAAGLLVAGFVHDLRAVALALGVALAGTYAVTARHIATLDPAARRDEPAAVPAPRATLVNLLLSRGAINLGFFTLLGFLLFFVRDSLRVAQADVSTQTALLFLAFTLSAVAGAALAARPADRYDKRAVASCAIGVAIVALAALALATTLPVAYGAATVAGVGWGAFVTADWALATAIMPSGGMATAMGIWNVATTLPQVIAPLLAAPLVTIAGSVHRGAGPRAAIAIAIVEFAIGVAALWRLPRVCVEQIADAFGDARRGIGMSQRRRARA